MKFKIRLFVLPVFLALFIISCDKQEAGNEQEIFLKAKTTAVIDLKNLNECFSSVDLIAGQHYYAGKINATGGTGADGYPCINIKIETENSWALTEIHVDVQTDPNLFPMTKSGSPKVGHFAYSDIFDASEKVMNYETACIPIPFADKSYDGPVYISVHAVVCGGITGYEDPDFTVFCTSLPETGSLIVTYPGSESYFNATISGTGTALDGTFESWCLDLGHYIYSNLPYQVKFASGICGNNLEGIIDKPENIGLVNYLLNQEYIGTTVPDHGEITWIDVQVAIWYLVDNEEDIDQIPLSYDKEKIDWILNDVFSNGYGYTPGCGEVAAVIVIPTDSSGAINAQVTVIPVPVPCTPVYGGCETAWSKGYDFPGNSWTMFFKYCQN